MDINLIGKDAIVCGSTQGIGKACALELASLGANVTLIARNEQKLKQVLTELDTSSDQRHHYLTADFSNHEEVKEKIQSYISTKQSIHILINNTGGPAPGDAINAEDHEFISAFSSHVLCNHHLVKAVVPRMKDVGYGRIINIISTSVKAPIPGLGVSNTIRGAVANWAKTLSRELAPFGITVNNVLPGMTKTGRLDAIIVNRAERQGITVEECENLMKENIPAKRFAEPEEVAATVAFLSSPSAGFINGINLPLDGGNTPSL